MWTFLGSDCFFFGSLIGTYMSCRGKSLNGPYPLDVFEAAVTSLSTFDLLLSSLFMVLAVHYAKLRDIPKFTFWTVLTMIGGAIFLSFQAYEFTSFVHEGLTLQSNLFGATFFVLTGFHGAHVAIGVLLLGSLLWSVRGGHVVDAGITTEVIGLYWHFVDIVWILIFTLVYLLEFTS
ncbi:MAG: cytochrome oxidase subunit III [Myxococcales bacterium]|nr:cytochrome oxidase subunit III [Myxococcales bacterium]